MSYRPKRKLIEVALPLEAISESSVHEKAVRVGHPNNVHFWWARRPLAACRGVLFTSLVDDPSSDPERYPTTRAVEIERDRLFRLVERLAAWMPGEDEGIFADAQAEIDRATGGAAPLVIDPFAGGGAIPLEAQRLGLTAVASDLNPVAVLINRVLIDLPARFRDRPSVHRASGVGTTRSGSWAGVTGLVEDVRFYGRWLRDEADRQVGHLYPTAKNRVGSHATVVAWLWARTVTCPNPACGASTPLARTFVLSKKPGREVYAQPVVDANRQVTFTVQSGTRAPDGTVSRTGARCVVCSAVISLDYLRSPGQRGPLGHQLMALALQSKRGREYIAPIEEHAIIAASAEPRWSPDELLSTHPQYMGTPRYGLVRFADLFTARQLVGLTTLIDLLPKVREQIEDDARRHAPSDDERTLAEGGVGPRAYAEAVSVYLACAISQTTARNNSLVTWMLSVECPGHLFARSAISMAWDFAEANLLSGPTGSFISILDGVANGLVAGASKRGPVGSANLMDARDLHVSGALICTDPPYYDNVPYADISDFYYVWLRRALDPILPDLFGTLLTPKAEELVADVTRFGGRERAAAYFEAGLGRVFENLREAADPRFPMSVFYAFRQTEEDGADVIGDGGATSTGWSTMLEALVGAGLVVEATWPIRTERQARARAIGSNALASSIILVCRRRPEDAKLTTRKDFVASLRRELPEALRTLQHGNVAPVDLAQASIGPGMAIFSRHVMVLEPDGSPMRVRTALTLINGALDGLLEEQEGEFDADTRWAIAWYGQFGLKDAEFGVAETLTKAKNTSIGGLVEAGIVAASHGRVRLLARSEYLAGWDPAKDTRIPVWEATHRLVHSLLTDGEVVAAELLGRLGGLGDIARDLAYRLYLLAERKGWTDEARAYNALVVAWTDLSRGAESVRTTQPAQSSLGLE